MGGKFKREGYDICIHIFDSLCRIAETNTILKSNYTSISKKLNTNTDLNLT